MSHFWLFSCWLHCTKQGELRDQISERYGLENNPGKNQARALCCVNCDLMAQEKEVVAREKERLVMNQPRKEENMAYGPA